MNLDFFSPKVTYLLSTLWTAAFIISLSKNSPGVHAATSLLAIMHWMCAFAMLAYAVIADFDKRAAP